MADDDAEETEETPDEEEQDPEEEASEESGQDEDETAEDETKSAEEEAAEEPEEDDEAAEEDEDDEADETAEDEETEEDEATDEEEAEDEDLEEVETAMEDEEPEEEETKTRPVVKSDQQYYGTGRRKESVARVWIEAGDGDITVNEVSADQYFQNRPKWTQAVKSPLETLDFEAEIDVWATAEGGGLTGQADAVKLGIARALVEMDENARSWLRSDGHLTRDDREVERKKINQPGARAKQQVSKR